MEPKEIKYKQPKLKDGLYGLMSWQDFNPDEEPHWFSMITDVPNEEFEALIYAGTHLDFMAVRNTHSTYKKIVADLKNIWASISSKYVG